MLEKVLRIVILYDFYGSLLTEKQSISLEMHYLNDFSLTEIAEELGVSRQAVHDMLKRSEELMIDYEEKLKFVARYQREQQTLQHIYDLLEGLPAKVGTIPELTLAVTELQGLLDYSKEV